MVAAVWISHSISHACAGDLLGVTVPRKEQTVYERVNYFRSLSSVIIRWIGLVPMFSVQWVMGSR